MITIALTLLQKYWKVVAVVIAVLAIYFYMQSLYGTIENQKTKITELTTANKILKENNDKLESAIKVNNEAIEKIAKGAAETNKAFSTLNGSVKQQSADLAKRLQDIMKEKKPQTCEDTILYLLDAAKGYAK